MTTEEAFDKLMECVENVGSGTFQSLDAAFVTAAKALNYIMDDMEKDVPLTASQIRKEAKVTKQDQQIARQAAKEGKDDNQSS